MDSCIHPQFFEVKNPLKYFEKNMYTKEGWDGVEYDGKGLDRVGLDEKGWDWIASALQRDTMQNRIGWD